MLGTVLTVVSFSAARKSRTPITQLVADHLRPEPTLLALLADRYTSESSLRPFAPLADKLADRMHVLVLAEWPQEEREREHKGRPAALINLFFRELPLGSGGPEDEQLRAWEDEALRKLETLLSRLLPPQPASAPRPPPPPDPGPRRDRFELIELD